MVHRRTGSVLVFNGEIYNHADIRKDLIRLGHDFLTNSDSETLLAALVEWGSDAIPKFNGDWSFAFYNNVSNQILLSRDRYGVKPLCYFVGDGFLVFSSEPKGILKLFPGMRRPNLEKLASFLVGGENLIDETYYNGILNIRPGCFVEYDVKLNKFSTHAYWEFSGLEAADITNKVAIEQFDFLMEDATKIRIASDVKNAIALSGGLDSSSILAACRSIDPADIRCFTSSYVPSGVDESYWADMAAQIANASSCHVPSTIDHWLDSLGRIVWHMDAPNASPAVYPTWNLTKRVSELGIKVLLEGQGADEIFAGYPHHAAHEILTSGSSALAKYRTFSQGLKCHGLHTLTQWMLRLKFQKLYGAYSSSRGVKGILRHDFFLDFGSLEDSRCLGSLKASLRFDHTENVLPALLHYGDSIGMAHGVESRYPYLDHRMVEFAFSLPSDMFFKMGEGKWLIRKFLNRHGFSRIASRTDKKGYPTPILSWMKECSMKELMQIVDGTVPVLDAWVDRRKLANVLNNISKINNNTAYHLYKLLTAKIWIERCL